MWHRGLDVLDRARTIRKRREQTEAMKATSKHLEKQLPHVQRKRRKQVPPQARPTAAKQKKAVTRSAPAKLITQKSSKGRRGKKK